MNIHTTNRISDRLFKTKASVYSFLSGAFLAVAVNLYTAIFSSDTMPSRWHAAVAATGLTTLSAILWAILAWKLEDIQDAFAFSKSVVINQNEAWMLLIEHRRNGLIALLLAAALLAVAGLCIVPIGIKAPHSQQDTSSALGYHSAEQPSVRLP